MNRLIVLICGLIILSIAPLQAAESLNAELTKCAAMSRDLQRLDCYDRLSGKVSSFAEEAVPENAIKAPLAGSAAITSTSSFGLKEKDKAPTPASSSNFGLKVTEEETLNDDTLVSSILGEFKGWRKNDLLKLANGQVWKVVDKRARLFYKANSPKITIKKTAFGTFRITLDGTTQSTLVVRTK